MGRRSRRSSRAQGLKRRPNWLSARQRRKLGATLSAVAVILGLVIAVLSLREDRKANRLAERQVEATSPLKAPLQVTPEVQIRVGPEFNGTWLYPSTRSDLGDPPTGFCDTNEYWSWLRAKKAVPAGNSFTVTLSSNTESTVIVEGMSVQVRDRRPPLAGILLECAIGDGGTGWVGSAIIDLDRATPSIAYTGPTEEPIKRLAFKLEKGVDQFLIINANSRRSHVTWDASLLLLVDGVRRPVPLRDPDTQGPFSTTPSEGGTEAWAVESGRWIRID